MKQICILSIILSYAVFSTAQTATYDVGVEINGVLWATRNVGAPGTFAENPEDAGMFYQWNNSVGWQANGNEAAISTNSSKWNRNWVGNGAEIWEPDNNVCPVSWRIPTYNDFMSLAETNQEKITIQEQVGRKFTDKITGNSVFLPMVGGLCWMTSRHFDNNRDSYYLINEACNSSDSEIGVLGYRARMTNVFTQPELGYAPVGSSIRCVKDQDAIYGIEIPSNENGTITCISGSQSGKKVTFLVTPNVGYELTNITVVREGGVNIEVEDLSFVMPDGAVTITADFSPIHTMIETITNDQIIVFSQQGEIIISNSNEEVLVYTIAGQLVAQGLGSGSYAVPQAGVYVVKIGAETRKIVVQ